jgi:hypothetical protein
MNRRETYERPKPNMLKATLGCFWLLALIGMVTAVMTAAIILVGRLLG